jgi:hypothetical protein
MAGRVPQPNAWLWTVGAIAGLAWGLIAVVIAAVGPPGLIPTFFHNYHAEHFVAFYVLTILACAGFPRASLRQLCLSVTLMAVVLALVRIAIPRHRLANAEDFIADLGGIIAAVVPILVGRFRQIIASRTETAGAPAPQE